MNNHTCTEANEELILLGDSDSLLDEKYLDGECNIRISSYYIFLTNLRG